MQIHLHHHVHKWYRYMYLPTIRSFMSINKNITFIHISRFILVSKSTSFTFFHMNIRLLITLFCRRFIYIHTFFHRKIMCSCRLATCLYDIQQTSYECRLHHIYVAPSVPIWDEFYTHLRQDMPIADSSRHACTEPRRTAAIIYRHILPGKIRLT